MMAAPGTTAHLQNLQNILNPGGYDPLTGLGGVGNQRLGAQGNPIFSLPPGVSYTPGSTPYLTTGQGAPGIPFHIRGPGDAPPVQAHVTAPTVDPRAAWVAAHGGQDPYNVAPTPTHVTGYGDPGAMPIIGPGGKTFSMKPQGPQDTFNVDPGTAQIVGGTIGNIIQHPSDIWQILGTLFGGV